MVNGERKIIVVEDVRELSLAQVGKAQRIFEPKHDIFKKDFDRNSVRITVSLREDGTKVVLDGQHSREFAIREGDYGPYLVEAFEGLTEAEEAARFLSYNNAKPVTAVEKFGPRVASGDPLAVRIQGILDRIDLRVAAGQGIGT